MKSRTSSFNLTVFKKDWARFAPGWAVYLIVLLLALISLMNDGEVYYRVRNMRDAILVTSWVNLIYGAVVAQLLFGDLYQSRLCNALHAMPLTRGSWFGTHIAAGVAFSLLPNLVIAILAVPMLNLGAGSAAVFWWLLAAEAQYLFFFGTAVLCVMLSGNRLGQLALYTMINFAGLLAYWLASSLYEPLLHGIQVNGEVFYPFCPVGEITQMSDVLIIDHTRLEDAFGNYAGHQVHGVAPGTGWGYMAICAGIGMLALATALVLYRRRRLECAGDLVAFSALEPVVTVLVTIFSGGFFHLFGDFFGLNIAYALLFSGMVVGYFGCRMLLERTTRVFRKKTFLTCGVIMAAFALTMLVTKLDPLGLTRYLPEKADVESVTVSNSYSIHRHGNDCFEVAGEADVEAILNVHRACIDKTATDKEGLHPDASAAQSIHLEYTLKNGKTVHRIYYVNLTTDAGQVLKGYFTRPECVLGFGPEQVPERARSIYSIYTDGRDILAQELAEMDPEGLLEAIVADCEAGNMAQIEGFHYPNGYDLDDEAFDPYVTSVEIVWGVRGTQGTEATYLNIFRSCQNTLRWLEAHDLLNEEQEKELGIVTATFATG